MHAQYITYNEYQEYGGTLGPAEFMQAEFDARKRVDRLTDMRVRDMAVIPDDVKRCMMSLIKIGTSSGAEAQISNPTVTSFNNDGYSESYGHALSAEDADRAMDSIIKSDLYGVLNDYGIPLLYRGVR